MHYLLLYFKLGLQEQNTFKIDLIDTSSSCMQEKKNDLMSALINNVAMVDCNAKCQRAA